MANILHITCSPVGPRSESYRLSERIIDLLLKRQPTATITHRSLGAGTIPHIDAEYAAALGAPEASPAEKRLEGSFSLSEELVQELENADYVVIGTPMHNFTVPSTLKAWIDHVARVRRTFTIGRQGKTALVRDRPVFVAVASGGRFSGVPGHQPDFLTPYLVTILGMIGLRDITFFSVEGTARGPEAVADTRARTERELETHFSSLSSPNSDESAKQRHLGELLDDGLKLIFPASDPVAPFIEEHLTGHRGR
jgi:FMN-dependent NADH-azoreductase